MTERFCWTCALFLMSMAALLVPCLVIVETDEQRALLAILCLVSIAESALFTWLATREGNKSC